MKKLLLSFVACAIIALMAGCGSSKNVPYFTNIDSVSLAASRGLYDAHIMPKDELSITVITTDPQASVPFNLAVQPSIGSSGQISTVVVPCKVILSTMTVSSTSLSSASSMWRV